jgi:hypothetical protein
MIIKNNLHKIRVKGQQEIILLNNAVKPTIIYGFWKFINLFWHLTVEYGARNFTVVKPTLNISEVQKCLKGPDYFNIYCSIIF